ncbi:retrovirus-related pol polyprotein from transposon TNT 1-94 [Tanacetum coccineum]
MAESEKRSPQQPPQAHTDQGFRTVSITLHYITPTIFMRFTCYIGLLQVKAFGKSLESLRPAIVVGGTNIIRSGFRGGVEIVAALHGRFINMGKENGVNILKSIDEGPFQMGTFRETLAEGNEDKDRYNVDIRAINILLQGLPKDIYSLINHYTDAKDIWDNVKMLLEGSELTKEDRESQLYDDFEHFCQHKGETIHDYYVRFAKLINDMRNIKMTMSRMQLNSKFVNNMLPEWGRFVTAVKLNRGLRDSNYDQLYAYLKQLEAHANENKMMLDRFTQHTVNPLALMSNVAPQQYNSQSSTNPSSTYVPPHFADNSQLDYGLSPTDNLIDNLPNTLALITQSYKTYLPQTNNQLRTSSNPRNQATVQDGRVVVKYYNCNGICHIARKCTQLKRPQNSEYFKDKMLLMQAQENGVALDEEQLLFLAGRHDNAVDEDLDEQPVQDLALNVDNVFQADDCDAFDSDVDEAPTTQTMFMANLSSADHVYDEADPSYDSDILSEVHDHDQYQDVVCEHHEEQEMHDDVQPNYVVDSHADYTIDNNMISYDLYVKDNAVPVVQSNVSSVPNDAYMMIYNDMFELTEREQKIDEQLRIVITDRNIKEENLKKELHSVKLQLASTINHNKSMVEEVTYLKKDFKQKENKYLEEFLDMKALKDKVKDKLYKQDQSLQTVHMLCKPKPYYDKLNKVAIGYKNSLCLTREKQAQPALYNVHEIIKTNHVPAIVHNSEDTLEIAEITRKKMNDKMKNPECVQKKVKIIPLDYSKENYLATFTPQKQLTPEKIFWSQDLIKMKAEALKTQATASRPIKALMMYPPNTPATLVPRVLPTKRERGFEQTKACYLTEVIPFFKTLKEHFKGIQKALTKKIKEIKDIFEELEAEVDQNCVDRKYDEIERKNLLIANDNLIADYLSKEVFYVATNSELNVSSFTEMHDAHTSLKARFLELEVEISNLHDKIQKDNHDELIKRFSNFEDHVKPKVLAPGKYAKDVKPIPPRNKNNREVHLVYLKHLKESVETLREIVEEAKVERPLDSSLASACRYTKHSQELLEYVIGTCLKALNTRDNKHASTSLPKKKQVTFEEQCAMSKSNTHKPVEQLNCQKTNVPVPPSTGVNSCTDASRSQPRSNTKKNRILPAKSVNMKKVEEHPRTIKSSLKTTNHVDSSISSKHTVVQIFVIVDDYSRFTWVKFLRSKDETPERTPQQNGVVKRRNRTLVEAVRTMLIFSKAPMFLWAEVVATACYTQNRSLIHTRHYKTPYELVNDKKHDLTFFRVFSALRYPTNDSEDLGKLQRTADIGIFVGYAPSRKGYIVYNKRTWRIMETIHVQFDELTEQTAPVQLSTGPAPTFLMPGQITVSVPVNLAVTPSSTSIDQDAPSLSHSPSSSALQYPSLHQGVTADSALMEDNPFAPFSRISLCFSNTSSSREMKQGSPAG